MVGWIKVHRKLMDHWLWDDPRRLKWWFAVLLEVNYSDGKMNFGNKLITVKRGSSTKSLRAWGEVFGCGIKAVTNFFDLLESDQMISRETIRRGKHSTTLIKVTNYEEYQGQEEKPKEKPKEKPEEKPNEIQGEYIEQRERHTIKEVNKIKNKKETKKSVFKPPSLDQVYNYMSEKGLNNFLANNESQKFINHYTSNGWKVGKNKMKNWKSAVSQWISRMKDYQSNMNFKKENNEKRSSQNGEARIGRTTNENLNRIINPEEWAINKY